jgi:undecaprenyl-diphosphatase
VAGIARDSIAAAGEVRRRRPLREAFRDRPNAWLLVLILVGSVPTALIGLLFKEMFERIFGEPKLVAGILLVTAGLLVLTRVVRPGERGLNRVGILLALIVGTVQGLAIIPGVSRSGSTIAFALLLGFDRDLAARFSFLLSVPAIGGALLLMLLDLDATHLDPVVLGVGFLTATLVGLGALALLMPLVRKGRLHWFAVYLVPLAVVGLTVLP